ncbi:MAG: AAA family ATPase [Marinifilaceae bacterium]
MDTVIIKDVGPISSVQLGLNKINIIIGPQSSGKSTIAKIISYCRWVEKRFLLDGEYNYKFSEQFINFHRIDKNYFSENSIIHYKSDFIDIKYEVKSLSEDLSSKVLDINKELGLFQSINKIESNNSFAKSKNIYIPAERNFVSVIPNLKKYNETNDNIMSFLYDWYSAKENYKQDNSLQILGLNIGYHHIKETDSDILVLNKDSKEISLKTASSGLQSVVPLIMLIEYLSNKFFEIKSPESVSEKDNSEKYIKEYINDFLTKEFKKHTSTIDTILAESEIDDKEFLEYTKALQKIKYTKALENLSSDFHKQKTLRSEYQFSSFIIEEPEQNLFPTTQRDLIYYILDKINNNERNHSLVLTTHSPYVLYAINNCMMGYKVQEEIEEEDKEKLPSLNSCINPDLVSVWEIKDGKINSIKNEETGTVGKHYFNEIMEELMDEYYLLLSYLE